MFTLAIEPRPTIKRNNRYHRKYLDRERFCTRWHSWKVHKTSNGVIHKYQFRIAKSYRKISNRKIRRYKGDLVNGRSCFRLYDYAWELY